MFLETSRLLIDDDPGAIAVGEHLLDRRDEQDVDALVGGHTRITVLVSRIGGQIPRIAELCRVDENGDSHKVTLRFCGTDQRHVSCVQRSHGWHKADVFASLPCRADGGARFVYTRDNFHLSVISLARFGVRTLLCLRPSQ